MNRFDTTETKKGILSNVNFSALLFIAVLIGFMIAVSDFADNNAANQKEILTDAISRDIVHCYAIEGSYPPSLDYIEEHYGLTYDHDRFLIDYEVMGSNLMPNVTIIERSPE